MAAKNLEDRARNVRRQVNAWTEKPGNSNNKLASAVGALSPAALSSFMRGVYSGNNENIVVKLENFFDLEKERQAIDIDQEFIFTRQAVKVEQFLRMAHAYQNICVIAGDSGLGKTMTLKQYAVKPNVYYIKCHPFMRGRTNFLQQVGLALDFQVKGNLITLYNKVVDFIDQSKPLLIFDDAQTLNPDSGLNTTVFEIIRDLHDRGAGIVICGNNKVRDSVTTTNDETFYQQLAARTNILNLNPSLKREDVEAVINGLIKGQLKEDEYDFLFQVANQFYGGLHLARRILMLAVTRGKSKGIPMSRRLLEDAAKHHVSQLKPQYRKKKRGVKLNGTETPDSNSKHQQQKETEPRTGTEG